MLNGDATKMAEAWSAAQQQMMENWLRMMESAPMTPEAWQALMQQGMQGWLDQAEPTARRAAEQMVDSQQAMLAFLQRAATDWQALAARINDGEDWQTVLDQFNEQLRTRLRVDNERWAAMLSQSAQIPVDLWGSYMQPWAQLWQNTAARMGATSINGAAMNSAGMSAPGAFGDLINQTFDAYRQTFGRFLDTPPLGYGREYEEKLRTWTKAAQEYGAATLVYQSIMGEAWANGMTKLMEALIRRSQEGQPIRTLQELSDEWSTIADPAFFEVFVSDEYVRAQGALLSATMRLKIAQRELTEEAAQALDMPTRTEVDAAHKALYAQKREMRALKRELAAANARLAALEEGAQQAASTAKTSASRKKRATKRKSAATGARATDKSETTASGKTSTRQSTTKSGGGKSSSTAKRGSARGRSANGTAPKNAPKKDEE